MSERIIQEAMYILTNNATVRETAKNFNISKSTVHKDMSERLIYLNKTLYLKVKEVLNYHLKTRHIRGGEETQKKYKLLRT